MIRPAPRRARRRPTGIARGLAILACLLACTPLAAQPPTYDINIRNHLFEPAELTIPANTKVRLAVHNLDPTPEEFESWELNREKVILGGQTATLFVGPLPPGEYPFFGEFNPKTAQGRLVVR